MLKSIQPWWFPVIGGQTQRGGCSASFERCCPAITQPFGLSPRDGGLVRFQLGAQASKLTARQIDIFLAFGGRILEAEQEEVLPLQRYWRHG